MGKLICIFLLLSLTHYHNSFSQWITQNSGTTSTLDGIYFINNNTGFVGKNTSEILYTTDGGASWAPKVMETGSLFDAFFLNQLTGYMAGGGGKIVKTTDGGINWTLYNTSASFIVNSIYFTNANTGFLCGSSNTILKTINGGVNWYSVTAFDTCTIHSISFFDDNTGIAVGSAYVFPYYRSKVYKTTNAGENWINLNQDFLEALFSVNCIDSSTAVAVGGGGKIVRTPNRGNLWQVINTSSLPPTYLQDLSFTSAQTGYACGSAGATIIKTTDAGLTWSSQSIPAATSIYSIYFPSKDTGYAAGSNGKILKTINGGVPVSIDPVSSVIPSQFNLFQNYPNPFNPETSIEFEIPENALVQLYVYNSIGEQVAALINGELNAGRYRTKFAGAGLSGGVYYYRLIAAGHIQTKKMLLVK